MWSFCFSPLLKHHHCIPDSPQIPPSEAASGPAGALITGRATELRRLADSSEFIQTRESYTGGFAWRCPGSGGERWTPVFRESVAFCARRRLLSAGPLLGNGNDPLVPTRPSQSCHLYEDARQRPSCLRRRAASRSRTMCCSSSLFHCLPGPHLNNGLLV
jgi:hypothetical protein